MLLYPITLYFFFRRGPERRASRAYLERVLGRRPRHGSVLKHIHCFSCTILDRLFLLGERFKRFDIRTYGLRDLDRVLEGGKGVLLIGTHLGSFDALRVLALERPEVPVRILLDMEQGARISQAAECAESGARGQHHQCAGRGPRGRHHDQAGARSQLHRRAARGSRPAEQPHAEREFSRPARRRFPTSPWLLAAALKVPVMLAFGLYRGGNRYDLHFEPFAESIAIERNRRAEALDGDSAAVRGPAGTLCAPGALQLVQLL